MKTLKIVVFEDDPDVLDFIKCGLEQLGVDYVFDAVKNGEEFKTRFKELKPDLVILDLMMPGITGFQVCSYLRMDPKFAKLKILAITGYDTPENKAKIMKAGADDYLPKPFEFKDLKEKLRCLVSEIK